MEVRRTARYRSPRYPERAALDRESARLMPKRWQANVKLAAAIAGALALTPLVKSARSAQRLGGDTAPARFLTESEARQIVIQEAKRAHITFGAGGPSIRIGLPAAKGHRKRQARYRIRAWDKKHRVGFAYVTWSEVEALGNSTDPVGLTKTLKRAVAKEHLGDRVRVVEEAVHVDYDADRRRLRQEVRSFLAWLKAQGVI